MQRSSFLASAVPLALCSASDCSGEPSQAIGLVETARQFDLKGFEKAVATSAEFRHVWDVGWMQPRVLGAVKNCLNGLQFGLNVPASAIATAFAAHGTSNLLLYDDAAWSAYDLGRLFGVKDPTGVLVRTNIFYPSRSGSGRDPSDVRGFYQDPSIAALQKRGVRFFVCNTALVEHAADVVRSGASRRSVDDVARDLRAHLVPGAMLVPSGVAAVTYLQARHRYAYMAQQQG